MAIKVVAEKAVAVLEFKPNQFQTRLDRLATRFSGVLADLRVRMVQQVGEWTWELFGQKTKRVVARISVAPNQVVAYVRRGRFRLRKALQALIAEFFQVAEFKPL